MVNRTGGFPPGCVASLLFDIPMPLQHGLVAHVLYLAEFRGASHTQRPARGVIMLRRFSFGWIVR